MFRHNRRWSIIAFGIVLILCCDSSHDLNLFAILFDNLWNSFAYHSIDIKDGNITYYCLGFKAPPHDSSFGSPKKNYDT